MYRGYLCHLWSILSSIYIYMCTTAEVLLLSLLLLCAIQGAHFWPHFTYSSHTPGATVRNFFDVGRSTGEAGGEQLMISVL